MATAGRVDQHGRYEHSPSGPAAASACHGLGRPVSCCHAGKHPVSGRAPVDGGRCCRSFALTLLVPPLAADLLAMALIVSGCRGFFGSLATRRGRLPGRRCPRRRARRPGRCESIALVIPQFRSTLRPTAQAYY
jgi:hypothetical protein